MAAKRKIEWRKIEWWSWFLTIYGGVFLYLAGTHSWAWLLGIGLEVAWGIYGWRSRQWGFLVSAGIFTVVFARNYLVGIGISA